MTWQDWFVLLIAAVCFVLLVKGLFFKRRRRSVGCASKLTTDSDVVCDGKDKASCTGCPFFSGGAERVS